MPLERCPKDGGYNWDGDTCRTCGYVRKPSPPPYSGNVDWREIAKGLKDKQRTNQMRMRKDDETQLAQLSDVIWVCPSCHVDAVRYDHKLNIFICWECCTQLPFSEGTKVLDGFKVGEQYCSLFG